jgi:predicted type IV restriction endonuclease
MAAPAVISELVRRFEDHREAYRAAPYSEAQLREEFLNPLFEALGWDVYNRKGYAEAYKEVIHEAAIKIGGRTKAPDYCFRAGGGKASFFVEAKKPSVDIREAVSPAYQLRRYAWSAKLPVSILTDFEELAVYDCRIRPAKTDKASTARIILLRYTEYTERWEELAGLFSPEAIRRGALEKLVASKKVKKGTAEVDAAFLAEIETWRDMLARNVALRNPGVSPRDLNFAVQRTVDRIVFLRICEDRAIEPYGTLQGVVNGPGVYRRLGELFQRADDRYNSGLFHFSPEKDRAEPPDELTLALSIDDKPLKDIIQSLYYPESPYEFSVLPAEILGQVYEQFLGKVIRLTKGGQAKVEEKPEVRKAGGVYYTPAYIVDYIVEHTVGELLNGGRGKAERRTAKPMTPKEAAKLKILDPACGSGSFLIGAYQRLLDWHRDQYVAEDPEKHARGRNPRVYRGLAGEWRLTSSERKRILLNNIYGVDIDPQAVEVTKLSLLLKVLEGQSKDIVNHQLRLFHERALPDLGRNIKCGNSLVGPDFYEGRQRDLFDEEEMLRINAFDWQAEFPDILRGRNPGFDAVIGNPPYGAHAAEAELAYYREKYVTAGRSCDSFALFVEMASLLLRPGGVLGMIVQSAFVSSPSMSNLRDLFVGRFKPLAFATMPYDVFAAYIDTVITIAKRLEKQQSLTDIREAPVQLTVFPPRYKVTSLADFAGFSKRADAVKWLQSGRNEFLVTLSDGERAIIDKLAGMGHRFSDVADIQRGVTPFELSARKPRPKGARAFSGVVRRYRLAEGRRAFIRYDESLAEYKPPRYFKGPRILLRELISRQFRLQATYTDKNYVTNKSMQSILLAKGEYDLYYVLGLLNSRMLSWYFLAVHSVGRRDDFPKIVLKQTRELPFRPIDFSNPRDKAQHDRMAGLVGAMLSLQKRVADVKTEHQKTVVKRQIDATDRQIDRLVYELYGLTEEDIVIVEEATR